MLKRENIPLIIGCAVGIIGGAIITNKLCRMNRSKTKHNRKTFGPDSGIKDGSTHRITRLSDLKITREKDCNCHCHDERHQKIAKEIKRIRIEPNKLTMLYGGKDTGYVIYYISDTRDIVSNNDGYYVGCYKPDGNYQPISSSGRSYMRAYDIHKLYDLNSAISTYLDFIDSTNDDVAE